MNTLTKKQLKRMNDVQEEDFVLINVLPRDQFRKEHIRTSINLPVMAMDFTEEVEKIAGGKARNIVVYCANSDCDASSKAASQLEQAGFEHVYDYQGGTEDWFSQAQAA